MAYGTETMMAMAMSGWTREQTIERRAAWNAAITGGAVTGRDGKADLRLVAALQARLGFTCDALKRAVYDHDLDGTRAADEAKPAYQRERLSDALANAIERTERTFARMHAAEDALAWHTKEVNERAVDAARTAIHAFDAEHPEIIGAIKAARDAEHARSFVARGLD